MAEEKAYNLEPVEDKDLDLENKFKQSQESEPSASSPESKTEALINKEGATEISSSEKDNSYSKILSKVQKKSDNPLPEDDEEIKSDANASINITDAESQIQNLVDLAMNKGVTHAVKVAKHLEDNYVLDMFHDNLMADELHEALLQKGLIREIK